MRLPAPSRLLVSAAAVAIAVIGVAVPTAAPTQQVSSYAALGDSFTAGPLIPNQLNDPIGCLRSDHNYPHLVAAALGVAEFRDASCAGAGTEDMKSAQNVNPGPDNPPQLDRLDAGTQVVTIGVGGNDIGFTEIIENCATADRSGTPCQDHYVDDGGDEISERITATAPKIDDVLDGIRSRSQDARVFVVNYLSILRSRARPQPPPLPMRTGALAVARS